MMKSDRNKGMASPDINPSLIALSFDSLSGKELAGYVEEECKTGFVNYWWNGMFYSSVNCVLFDFMGME